VQVRWETVHMFVLIYLFCHRKGFHSNQTKLRNSMEENDNSLPPPKLF
jgi:hypothetical protein